MADTDTKQPAAPGVVSITVDDVQRALQEGFKQGWKAGCEKIVGFFKRELEEAHRQGITHDKCFMPVADVSLACLHIADNPPTVTVQFQPMAPANDRTEV